MSSLKLKLCDEEGGQPEKFDDLPLDITVGQVIEEYKKKTNSQTFGHMMYIKLNDDCELIIDQQNDLDLKMVDILDLDNEDYKKTHLIYLRTNKAGPSKDQDLKFHLWNALHESIQVKVKYPAVIDHDPNKQQNLKIGAGVEVPTGGNANFNWGNNITHREGHAYQRDEEKEDILEIKPHKPESVQVNSGIVGRQIKVEIRKKNEQGRWYIPNFLRTGNQESCIESITYGKHYVIYPLPNGEFDLYERKSRKWSPLDALMDRNKWVANSQNHAPHGCLPKGKRCVKCGALTKSKGWMLKERNFQEIHPISLLINGECPLECEYNKPMPNAPALG